MKKRIRIIYWIATIWLCMGMISTAAVQLFRIQAGGPGTEENLLHLGYPAYILTFLGVSKVLGVITLLIPGFAVLKEWAYAGIFFTVTGALYSHIASVDALKSMLPCLLYLVLIATSWYCRPSDRKMMFSNK